MPNFVNVAVPEDLVEDVYTLISERRRAAAHETRSADLHLTETSDSKPASWSAETLRELLDASTASTRAIVERVAETPSDRLPTPVLAEVGGLKGGRGMGGWVSRVRTLCHNRWGLPLPIEADWDEEIGHNRWTMDPEVAEMVKRLA